MTTTVCVVTGSRAEFGLLRWLMAEIAADPLLRLQIVVTGMHLAPEFGHTYQEIEECGFNIDDRVEILLSGDTASAVTKSIGLGLIGFADVFRRLSPDIVVLLGDRFEAFAAGTAAVVARIPIAHIHGGEVTEGAIDEVFRHSLTKMASLHFVATAEYARRVVQLGESPDRVFNVGGLGVDAIHRIALISRPELEQQLGLTFEKRNLLITYHPTTATEVNADLAFLQEALGVLGELRETSLFFTMSNADAGGRSLGKLVHDFVERTPNAWVFHSLGQLRYLSLLRQVDGVIGNSSSGLLEAPSLGVGTINIGQRQSGRARATSVIDCEATPTSLRKALNRFYSEAYRAGLGDTKSPYGEGGASARIATHLRGVRLVDLQKKKFWDLDKLAN